MPCAPASWRATARKAWPSVDAAALDNPMWSALKGPHRELALGMSELRWYPPSIAPFVAMGSAGIVPDLESAHRQCLGNPS
jgi:hypothetical protein